LRPTEGDTAQWGRIRNKARELQRKTEAALAAINEYNRDLFKSGDTVELLTKENIRVVIDPKYWDLFSETEEQFSRKDDVLSQMYVATQPPAKDQAERWRQQLEAQLKELSNKTGAILQTLPVDRNG
jgi:hypothetical protein